MNRKITHIACLIAVVIGGLLTFSCTTEKEKGKFLNVDVTETISLQGIRGRVEVARDEWGVPHIYSDNDHDLFYVQGYLHAQDRLFQMLLLRAAAQGQLGLFAGTDQLVTDVAVRLFKFGPIAQEIWDAASSEDRATLQAHSDGVNEYIKTAKWEDLPFELLGLGFTNLSRFEDLPWTPIDSIAFARLMTWDLSFDNEGDKGIAFQTIMKSLEGYYTAIGASNPTQTAMGMTADLFTPTTVKGTTISLPATYGTAPPFLAGKSVNVGKIKALERIQSLRNRLFGPKGMSNSWAVAPANTASGHALLANDPHLSLDQPPIFHEVHLNTKKQGGKYNMAGVMFPPDPGVVIGFNEDLAWGETTTGYDVTDFYVELLTTTSLNKPWKVCKPDTPDPAPCFAGNNLSDVATRDEKFMYDADKSSKDPCAIDQAIIDDIEAEYPVEVGTPSTLLLSKGVCLLPVTYYEVQGIESVRPVNRPVVSTLPAGVAGPTAALVSFRWTGLEESTELRAFFGYWTAKDANEFKLSAQNFSVGAQNHLVADMNGSIGWFPMAWIPIKDVVSCNAQSEVTTGLSAPPYLPQPGFLKSCDWQGFLPLETLPQLLDPEEGYIVTANNAPLPPGPSASVPYYHGTYYDIGYRAWRIGERITELVTSGKKISVDDMMSIQADSYLGPCEDFLPLLTATVGACFTASPPAYCAITTMPTGASDAFATLESWDCSTPSGIEMTPSGPVGSKDPVVRSNSAAASVFHAWFGNFVHDTFDDQTYGQGVGGDQLSQALYNITFRPNCAYTAGQPCQLTGHGPAASSYFWDDIGTTPTTETRDMIIVRAFAEAVQALSEPQVLDPESDRLTGGFGSSDVEGWLWGKLHKVILRHLAGISLLDIPSPYDMFYAGGFPRSGGNFGVDSADPGVAKATVSSPRSFTYSSGPSYRMVAELDPDGIKVYSAIPGGQVARPSSKHYDDQMRQLWSVNKYKQFWFADKDVEAHAVSLTVFLKP